jgi:hypothetical protein
VQRLALHAMFVLMIVLGFHSPGNSQPATRAVPRQAIPKIDRDRRAAKIVTPPQIAVIKKVVLLQRWCPSGITATLLDDGEVFVGWTIKDQADEIVREGIFYTKSLQKGPSIYYSLGWTHHERVKAFSDGAILGASSGGYVIVSPEGKIATQKTAFDNEQISDVSVTRLSGGKAMLIAYQRTVGARADGRYIIVDRSGKIIHGPSIFSAQGRTQYISATTLSNGLIHLAYDCSGSKTKVIDVFNHTIVGEHKFHAKLIYGIESIVLDNDNILLAYIDQDSKGQCMVVQPNGSKVSGPHQFSNGDEGIMKIRLAKRADGNVCLVFAVEKSRGRCAILDTDGKVIKGPITLYDGYVVENISFDCVHLRDNMVMIPLSVRKLGSDDLADRMGGYLVVR